MCLSKVIKRLIIIVTIFVLGFFIGKLKPQNVEEHKYIDVASINDNTTSNEKKTENDSSASSDDKDNIIDVGEDIKSANINDYKVYFNGNEIELKNKLLTILKQDSSEAEIYMPMKELLEYMNFKVEFDKEKESVYLIMGQTNNYNYNEPTGSTNEIDKEAIEIIQKTGNWSYIEKYIPNMSDEGIKKVVEIYNSKHMNISEHKKVSDYINKFR